MVYAGREWRIPLDVDTWPLESLRTCIGRGAKDKLAVNHFVVADVLETVLKDQFREFLVAAPRRRDLVPASQRFAEAVGIPATSELSTTGERLDLAFGGIPRLLALIHTWPQAVESDLNRFWSLDYLDRWRYDKRGRRRLTLRAINVRLSHLPPESALALRMGRRSPTELLLMDLYEPLAGRAHPARPLSPQQLAERQAEAKAKAKALADYEARRTARGDRGINEKLAAARANAQRTERGR